MLSTQPNVDALLLFEEELAPYKDYQFGGRFYIRIYIKIIDAGSGRTILKTIKSYGAQYPDPRPRFKGWAELSNSDINSFRSVCLDMFEFELSYALGEARAGWTVSERRLLSDPIIMGPIMEGSPAQRAGIQEGDKIIALDHAPIKNFSDFHEFFEKERPRQGARLKVGLEREGKTRDSEIIYPLIPD